MPAMGRRRKTGADLEPRVYLNHGAYFYVHPGGRWERLGVDKDAANARARIFNDPERLHGTLSYWLDEFLADCDRRVLLKSTVRGVKMSARTVEDYRDAFGTREAPGPVRAFWGPPRTPLDVTPDSVQTFLRDQAELGRAVQGNRQRAALSSCMGWLIREGEVPGLQVNPCLRGSGVQRNPESKRTRYVTDADYAAVYAEANRAVRLLMELTLRTLQRPESDIIRWDSRVVTGDVTGRYLKFRQYKTGRDMVIAVEGELDELLPKPEGNVRRLVEPLVRRLDGEFYTYDGLSAMLKRAIAAASAKRTAAGGEPILSFGFRDLKGKGATDMWLAGEPIETIQALIGHASKTTTEIYVKQRWHEAARPNRTAKAQR